MSLLINILSFIVAVGVLVTFHEFGHYWVARKVGVKVLRFSIGFGRPLWKRVGGTDHTEYVIAAIPLGGYVKMLDEREGEVDPNELNRAFNRQRVSRRIAIVAAGPLFNFIFAILAYWLMFMVGVSGVKPVIGDVEPNSIAAEAGFMSGEQILRVNDDLTPTWEIASIRLLHHALDADQIRVEVQDVKGRIQQHYLELHDTQALLADGDLLGKLGIRPWRPTILPVIGDVIEGGAAQQGGLQSGDRIVSANGESMTTWNDWVNFVRARPAQTISIQVKRNDIEITLTLQTDSQFEKGLEIGRIGAYPQIDHDQLSNMRVQVHYGPLESLLKSLTKTWDITVLTLKVMWKLITGEASLKNISGPVTIAEFAGMSVVLGLSAFLGALAIFSISIGILNLLPVPVLDGGHLLYYFIEVIKGSPVSEAVEAVGQRVGIAMLAGLMALAFYNDLVRLFG